MNTAAKRRRANGIGNTSLLCCDKGGFQGIIDDQGGMIGKTLVLIDSYPHYPIHERWGRHLVIDTPADVLAPRLS